MTISVPATSANLGPGFDTLGLALNLRNSVNIRPSKFFSISINGEDSTNIKLKNNNFFFSIFDEELREIGFKKRNYRFIFTNEIPISRGLGSSASVIVSAIASAHAIANIGINRGKILNKALTYENHPDNITSAVMGGFNTSIVENGKVISSKKKLSESIKAILVVPNKSISTSESRRGIPKFINKNIAIYNISRASLLTSIFYNQNWELLKAASKDKIHQNIRMSSMKELFDIQKTALELGCLMSTLSGSGSTMFNICYKNGSKKIAKQLMSKFPTFRVLEVHFDNKGLIIY